MKMLETTLSSNIANFEKYAVGQKSKYPFLYHFIDTFKKDEQHKSKKTKEVNPEWDVLY